jgi:hypothetical protein
MDKNNRVQMRAWFSLDIRVFLRRLSQNCRQETQPDTIDKAQSRYDKLKSN